MNKIPMLINNVERFGLFRLSQERQAFKESRGIQSQKVDESITNPEMHYVGLKAEHAVAKLLGLEINMENTYGGDGGVDLHYRGITIDVKFSSYHLNVKKDKEIVADVVVLVNPLTTSLKYDGTYYNAVEDPDVAKPKFAWAHCVIVGWIKKGEYYSLRELKDAKFKNLDYWSVGAHNMHDMFTLKGYAMSLSTSRDSDSFYGDTQ
ncbi:MAG: hypothetical protein ACYSW6_04875 [Planctomycetota bacterium]|jgi:hypothetical protein